MLNFVWGFIALVGLISIPFSISLWKVGKKKEVLLGVSLMVTPIVLVLLITFLAKFFI